jgi:hypothetical protein
VPECEGGAQRRGAGCRVGHVRRLLRQLWCRRHSQVGWGGRWCVCGGEQVSMKCLHETSG